LQSSTFLDVGLFHSCDSTDFVAEIQFLAQVRGCLEGKPERMSTPILPPMVHVILEHVMLMNRR